MIIYINLCTCDEKQKDPKICNFKLLEITVMVQKESPECKTESVK